MRRTPPAAGVLLVWLALLPACSGSSGPDAHAGPSGTLTVLAAASLRAVFTDLQRAMRTSLPRLDVAFSFAGSQVLAAQVREGVPADVIATADEATMHPLGAARLVDGEVVFARSRLTIAVAPGNPRGIRSLADLARPELRVVLGGPTVPFGRYARQALDHAGVRVAAVSLELDVGSAVRKVASGDADAAIVYVTDVGSGIDGVAIAGPDNVEVRYPAAVVSRTAHRVAAQAFLRTLTGPGGRAVLTAHHFGVP